MAESGWAGGVVSMYHQLAIFLVRGHGVLAAGACNAKSEIPDHRDQGRRLIIEWTADL
jgi:hypothetical protein